jgi:predicted class III extradiol MEMO1 family dioxygenase
MSEKHLKRVRNLKCVVCLHMGQVQQGKTFAHHVESVRDEASDYAAVALCYEHHQGPNGVHGLSRRGFEMRYRLTDVDLIALTIRQLDKEGAMA